MKQAVEMAEFERAEKIIIGLSSTCLATLSIVYCNLLGLARALDANANRDQLDDFV